MHLASWQKNCNSTRAISEPVFEAKGDTGGGYSEFYGGYKSFIQDIHVTTANNLIAALLDNSYSAGNVLDIDPRRIIWKRCFGYER